ncbi:RelA/SpoT family protein [Bacteroidales bacterium OttesenSCG-928-K03]|nr:RelA/SpoT family protein [Odoribacter sp. OttesenSCG-928-L07]MDL2239404.1 RelA/SpoT family protein [Bacteroidales bacterium OttesenSCG-928-L14]MDL2240736.1 RelA/SpoT family protein [Bacteroidales bacterium OttesenSCG-928-K22]MDL2242731.1 RelA/SpoT family protein [Bacteroidales bacterium OttesenSCG-928-K03]
MYEIDPEKEAIEIENGYKRILKAWKPKKKTKEDVALIRKAFDVAVEAHSKDRRKSGEPFIYHPIAVAEITAQELGLGKTSIVCALLHDVVEDNKNYTLDYIKKEFGETVAKIIEGLTKIDKVSSINGSISPQSETFRKILLAFAYDIRVILIKLADRLHNMRTLEFMPRDKQIKIASETEYIYASLAHRLGYYNIKSELEDLSLKYLEPEVYKMIDDKIQEKKKDYLRFINKFVYPIKHDIAELGLKFEIFARFKSVYSIWKKMSDKKVDFDDIDDLFAIRIVIDSPPALEKFDCWKVYSIVTNYYNPKQDRLRDWISTPKANGYESLHATVMSNTGQWVEVQIRSKRMDEIAENGLAAHWKYKEKSDNVDTRLDQWINQMKNLIENHKIESEEEEDAVEFIDEFKPNLFNDEIFVFTPKGHLRTLPKGASVLDFAYAIHTDIGNHCIGAKINNSLASINEILKNGDQIEILNSKKQYPKESWLEMVITQRAKARIRMAINTMKKEKFDEGKKKVSEWLKELNIEVNDVAFNELLMKSKRHSLSDLFFDVAIGTLNFDDIKSLYKSPEKSRWYSSLPFFGKAKSSGKSLDEIIKDQADIDPTPLLLNSETTNLDYTLCKICNPIPGDDVMAVVSPGREIIIHRTNCPEAIKHMAQFGNRIVKAKWRKEDKTVGFLTRIELKGIDRKGLIAEISTIIGNNFNFNIRTLHIKASEGIFEGKITLYVSDTDALQHLIHELKQVDGIQSVVRVNRR